VSEAPASGRGEPGRLPARRDGFLQPGYARIDLAGLHVGVLGAFGVAAIECAGHLFEHGHRFLEEGVGSLFDHTLGVDREKGIYEQGGAAPDQGLQKPLQRKAGIRGVEGDHDDHRRDGGLFDADLFAPQEHGQGHGQGHYESGLQSTDPDDEDKEVGYRDPEGHPERQFDGATAAFAHGEPEADDGCYGGEGRPVHTEEQDGKKPRRAGCHRRLEDLQPPAPEKEDARTQPMAHANIGSDPLLPRIILARSHTTLRLTQLPE
jgi:hypothetical protein